MVYKLKIMATKKRKKMDPKLVASKQKSEVSYVAKRHKIKASVVRDVIKQVGISRAKVYARLRELGYQIKTR